MATGDRVSYPWEKPPYGTRLNRQDSLTGGLVADYLFAEGHGRSVRDNVQGLDLFWVSTSAEPKWIGARSDVNPQTTANSKTGIRHGPHVDFPATANHFFRAPFNYPHFGVTRRLSVELWCWRTAGIEFPVPIEMAPVNTYWSFVRATTTMIFRVGGLGGDVTDTGAFPTDPPLRWQHFLGTYDADAPSPQLKLYRDGLLRASVTRTVSIPALTSSSRMCIGDADSGTNMWSGGIAIVRFWNRALHPEEVWTLYQYPFRMYEDWKRRSILALTALSRQAHVPVDWAGAFRRQANVPTDWAGTLGTRQVFIPIEWQSQTGARQTLIPVEWLAGLSRKATIPVEWFDTIRRSALIPTDWAGTAATRQTLIPIVWAGVSRPRQAFMPAEWAGLDPNLLLHRWNVIQPLSSPLLHIWDIVSDMLDSGFPIEHVWSVFEQLAAVTHRWNVTPDVVTPFSDDVQEPTAEGDKTP